MPSTIEPVVTRISSSGDADVHLVTWPAVAAGDTCKPYAGPGWADRNVQILGTAGTGLHVKFEGSNAGTPADPSRNLKLIEPISSDYSNLTLDGTAIDMTAIGGWSGFDVVPVFVRPVVTGDGATLITIRMLIRRTK